ncbi:MAG TPA: matrixin family metalloprotease [Saprospiraceae bacterium]|jgi:hypothetical protein|nr:matrixin family metalloprotease [Saprospiraceae bacterium]HMT71892.1 matrixin family metalloprotease [Saprospiraceae bacterium]
MKNFKFLILMLLTLVNIQSIFSQISVPYGDDAIGDNNNPNLEEFVVHGNNWDCRYLTYTFVNGTGDIAGVQEEDAVRRAMVSWSAVANINFIEVCNEVDADLRISWEVGNHGDGSPFDNGGGANGNVLAHAFFPPPNSGLLAGDLHFDDFENWRINGNDFDLETVALHELGHSLGLRHTPVNNSVMEAVYEGVRRNLTQDDIDGMVSIYGVQTNPIIGADMLCNEGSYSLIEFNCLNPIIDITWETTGGINIISGQGTGQITVGIGANSGNGSIIAILNSGCGELRFERSIRYFDCIKFNECCPPGSSFDGANCYYGIHFAGVNGFIYNNAFYTTRNCNEYPSNNCCPPGSTFDGANCYFGIHIPAGHTGFIYNNSFYTTKNCEKNCCPPGFEYDGANCYSKFHFSGVKGFIYDGNFYTTRNCKMYEDNNCCPPGTTFDGANCYYGRVPVGYEGFILNGSFYTRPNCKTCCPPGSTFDGANCYFGIHFEGEGFVYNNSFYTVPNCKIYTDNNCCPPGSTFDSRNCYFGVHFGEEYEGFVYNGSFYTRPIDCYGLTNNLGRESNNEPLVLLSDKEIEIRLAQSKEINIFPNPFYDFINIDISQSKEEITSIDVYSSDGKLLEHLDQSRISPINTLKPSIESGLVVIIVSFKSGNKIFKSIKI